MSGFNDRCRSWFLLEPVEPTGVSARQQAAAEYPDYLETTYCDGRNNLTYYMK
ncbi:hypothetical protein ACRQ5Q_24000 [Bradyrhizobium sp. PMVTL-01]|uniref:hypothetical protein n=1 Tax=unclassified Bradyrhizobium TaxID=2631580 RepID=UPI003F71832B